MTIEDIIKRLEAIKEQHGNLPLKKWEDGYYKDIRICVPLSENNDGIANHVMID